MSNRSFLIFLLFSVSLAWIAPLQWYDTPDIQVFREPSTYAGKIFIEDVAWGSGDPYIMVSVKNIPHTTNITGWSIENEAGRRIEIGEGVSSYRLGIVNKATPIFVATGSSVILSLTDSPIGVSFQENMCSGYLRGTKQFQPPMNRDCPLLESSLLFSSLDPTCKVLLETIPRCETISPEHVAKVSSACNEFFRTIPTYTHCIENLPQMEKSQKWRIFLGRIPEIIHPDEGRVYLIDSQGKTVDTYSYHSIGLK